MEEFPTLQIQHEYVVLLASIQGAESVVNHGNASITNHGKLLHLDLFARLRGWASEHLVRQFIILSPGEIRECWVLVSPWHCRLHFRMFKLSWSSAEVRGSLVVGAPPQWALRILDGWATWVSKQRKTHPTRTRSPTALPDKAGEKAYLHTRRRSRPSI